MQLRRALAEARLAGESFSEAWERIFPRGLVYPHDTHARRAWKEALRATRAEWEAAYDGRPTTFATTAAALLLEDAREATHGERVSA